MYDKYTLDRCDALEWLAKNLVEWPSEIVDGISDNAGQDLFNGWHFIRMLSGSIIFDDWVSLRITESDFYNFLHDYAGTELTRYGENEA